MSGLQLRCISAAENEFLAEETMIKMVPNFTHPVLHFISGDFGPFDSDVDTDVPLWLAITLRKKDKCKIVIPDWLKPENLEDTVKNERTQRVFQELPYHYMEIALLLLSNARDEIQEPDRVLALLQDIENIRMDRTIVGMQSVAETVRNGDLVHAAQLNNIGSVEVAAIKRFSLDSMDIFRNLTTVEPSSNPSFAGTAGNGNDNDPDGNGNGRQPQPPPQSSRVLRKFRKS
eukprot:gene992-1943_t